MTEKKVLMKAEHLTKEYGVRSAFGVKKKEAVHAVSDVSLEIYQGETLSLVGESGCGKSTLGRLLVRLLEPTGGEIWYKEDEITRMPEKELNRIRQKIQMVFQDPYSSLDPRMTVEKLISEPMMAQKTYRTKEERKARVLELMHMVGIRPEMINRYPHQFSGGMKQRVIIAIALACSPKLLIADEPTTALDVTIQAQILHLMRELKEKKNTSVIMITHDLGIVAETCDRVAVMYAGKIIEEGTLDEVFNHTLHPYTEGLFNSLPNIKNRTARLRPIHGLMPDPTDLPEGCAFAPRCNYATEACKKRRPDLVTFTGTHKAACLAYEDKDFHIERGKKNG